MLNFWLLTMKICVKLLPRSLLFFPVFSKCNYFFFFFFCAMPCWMKHLHGCSAPEVCFCSIVAACVDAGAAGRERTGWGRVWQRCGCRYWWTAILVTNQHWAHEKTQKNSLISKPMANKVLFHAESKYFDNIYLNRSEGCPKMWALAPVFVILNVG